MLILNDSYFAYFLGTYDEISNDIPLHLFNGQAFVLRSGAPTKVLYPQWTF